MLAHSALPTIKIEYPYGLFFLGLQFFHFEFLDIKFLSINAVGK